MDSLETNIIALDTQFLEEHNFFSGLLKELGANSQVGRIKIYITEIVKRESLKHLREKLLQARGVLGEKKNKVGILRYIPRFDPFFNLSVDLENDYTIIAERFENWLRDNKVEIVPTDHILIKDVFDDYFNTRPPFETAKEKKNEFPDAFSLYALTRYLESKRERCYFISGDKGTNRYENERVIMGVQCGDILAALAKMYENSDVLELIENIYLINEKWIIEKITEQLTEEITNELQIAKDYMRISSYSDVNTAFQGVKEKNIIEAKDGQYTMQLVYKYNIWSRLTFQNRAGGIYGRFYNPLTSLAGFEIPLPRNKELNVEIHLSGTYDTSKAKVTFKDYIMVPQSFLDF